MPSKFANKNFPFARKFYVVLAWGFIYSFRDTPSPSESRESRKSAESHE